jgi:endonuclease YncB( thermonuclease family)
LGELSLDTPRSRLSLLFALLLLLISVSSSHAAASVLEGTAVKIADGDTITVLDSNKVQHRVRIAGIDPAHHSMDAAAGAAARVA